MARTAKPWYRSDRKAWFVTIDGTRHNLGPDKKTAFTLFHALMREPKYESAKSQSFVVIADAFVEWLHVHRSEGTVGFYQYRVERFCRKFPDLLLTELRPFHVQQWIDDYPSLSKTSRRNYCRSLKRCVNWAYRQGFITEDLLRNLEMPGAEHREVCISKPQFEKMLSLIPDENFSKLCIVAFETGARPQELLRLEARHYDAKHSRWVFTVKESKGKRQPRIVYLSPNAESITRDLIAQFPEGRLFRNRHGRPWTTDATNCAVARLQQRMGKLAMQEQGIELEAAIEQELKKTKDKRKLADLTSKERGKIAHRVIAGFAERCSLYALRHSWATAALQSGLDGLTVGILLGHNDPSTLSRVYQHLSHNPEHLLSQARRTVRN